MEDDHMPRTENISELFHLKIFTLIFVPELWLPTPLRFVWGCCCKFNLNNLNFHLFEKKEIPYSEKTMQKKNPQKYFLSNSLQFAAMQVIV